MSPTYRRFGGRPLKKPIYKSKANWTGVVLIITSISKYLGVDIPEEAIYSLLALLGIFLRHGIEQNKDSRGRIIP